MRRIVFIALLAVSSSTAVARDIFVDNIAGDDRLCGDAAVAITNSDGPVRTITKALKLALRGDRIVLANTAQPYRESVTIAGQRLSGYPDKPLIIEGNGAILDGSQRVPSDKWQFVRGDIFRYQPERMAHQQLFNEGRPVTRRPTPAIGEPLPDLAPMEWCLFDGWIYFRGEPNQIPQNYALTCAGLQTGVTLYKVHHLVINNLVVQGYQLDGISAADGVRDTRILSSTCRGNGRAGMSVSGGSRIEVAGCTLGDNGVAQLLLDEYSTTRLYNSLLIPNTAPEIVRRGQSRLIVDGKLDSSSTEVAR